MSTPLKILIVDDSITYRSILSNVLKTIQNVEVVSTASNGKSALIKLSQNPVDIVLLDIEMPEMDGLETLKVVSQLYSSMGVVMISGTNERSADITIRALQAGALDFISKPDSDNITDNIEELRKRLIPIFDHFIETRKPKVPDPEPVAVSKPSLSPSLKRKLAKLRPTNLNPEVVVIGVSTGGPNALNEVIPRLPDDLGVPILIVQHMPPVFTASLANSLAQKAKLRIKEAQAGENLAPNTVYIAPGGKHMAVKLTRTGIKQIELNDNPPENSCRPSVDVLFRSVAKAYTGNILAVIMTGMGSDGVKGMQVLDETGRCYCLTQSADTCVVYGMPKVIDELDLSNEQVPLSQLASRISTLVKGRSIKDIAL